MGSLIVRFAAALVHAFTASGAVCALMAALAFLDHAPQAGFAWLGLAFFIDGIDGTFARWVNVRERLPRFSGEVLDLVVDYVTYVFVPVLALLHNGFIAGLEGLVLAAGMLLSSLFHFADREGKDAAYRFVGFPAIWNIVAFYVFALGLSRLSAGVLIVVCIALTFVPTLWVHPIRVVERRSLTLAATVAWVVAAVWVTWTGFPAGPMPTGVLIAVAAYGVGTSLGATRRSCPR